MKGVQLIQQLLGRRALRINGVEQGLRHVLHDVLVACGGQALIAELVLQCLEDKDEASVQNGILKERLSSERQHRRQVVSVQPLCDQRPYLRVGLSHGPVLEGRRG